MWKTIFGKKKSMDEMEKLKQAADSNDFQIYPILKPGDWVGIKAGAIWQTLVGPQDQPKVVIGFGYDTPENFIFLNQQHLEKMNSENIISSAYQNLEKYQTEFEYSEVLNKRVLFSSGPDFSSERILIKEHMQIAHNMLNAEEIVVSIPRRRCMMVANKDEYEDLIEKFISLHKKAWYEDEYGNAPITNDLFLLKEGDITSTIKVKM